MRPGCRLVRGVRLVLVPGLSGPRPKIDLESGAGLSMPGFSGSTLRTDPAVPKMSSRVPGKIRQLAAYGDAGNIQEKSF